MEALSENAHVKNVAHLAILLTRIEALGSVYCPEKEALRILALQQKLETAKKDLKRVRNAREAYDAAFSARQSAYEYLRILRAGLLDNFRASVNNINEIAKVYSLVRKINISGLKAAKYAKNRIRCQKYYDAINEHLQQLIYVIETNPAYIASDSEFEIQKLKELFIDLWDKNNAVVLSNIALNTAKLIRDKFLYAPVSGLVDTANNVKGYVEEALLPPTPQCKRILSLTFKGLA